MDIKKAWKSAHAARSSTGAFALPVKENEQPQSPRRYHIPGHGTSSPGTTDIQQTQASTAAHSCLNIESCEVSVDKN